MPIKYEWRGTSVIWKTNTFFSTEVRPSDWWAEGKEGDYTQGVDIGERPEACSFVIGTVLNYTFNERNLDQPLKKIIYNFISIIAAFYSFWNKLSQEQQFWKCVLWEKRCWISQYPCLFCCVFFFSLKISCIVREEKSSLTHKCILILMYIWYRPQSNLIKCTLPVVSYNKLAALVPGKINTDL